MTYSKALICFFALEERHGDAGVVVVLGTIVFTFTLQYFNAVIGIEMSAVGCNGCVVLDNDFGSRFSLDFVILFDDQLRSCSLGRIQFNVPLEIIAQNNLAKERLDQS